MAQRDASKVQLDNPQLTADIIANLRLTGTLGLFDMSDVVIPVISVGDVRPQTINVVQPTFTSAGVFSFDVVAPALNSIMADTGPLPAGDYDIQVGWSVSNSSGFVNWEFQHRNAANAATLARWPHHLQGDAFSLLQSMPLAFGYTLALNERLRFQILIAAGSVSSRFNTWIMAQIRPTP